ncbi:MAG: N-methyl-L-tryptophan oxidase [Verrucomicrobiota bacterium]|nr:N-methyl-L-tryptophan oxidase [Verrucomicrobiota bacterium]
MTYDLCVAGLGGMGSAIAAQAAARGARVLGLEQFARGHELGASSGRTRMIRQAYFEDPAYVPLLLRAYELWHALERESGEELLTTTGVLAVGPETSEVVSGISRAAREHNLPVEHWSRQEVQRRYPMLKMLPEEIAVFEPAAGVLQPERAIAAQLQLAERDGAELRFEAAMTRWDARDNGGFDVLLSDGSQLAARTLVLALGPWVQRTLGELGVPIRVQRNVQAWFAPATGDYAVGRFPAFLLERTDLPAPLYGFPDFGHGMKAAFHGAGEFTNAEQIDREIHEACDIAPLARALDAWMPHAAASFLEAKACMYSLTPDEHFVFDRHPAHERLLLCGGFSGHGFKFAPVIGEIAADLALNGGTAHPIGFLSLQRFAGV